jgi:hypothetical protein
MFWIEKSVPLLILISEKPCQKLFMSSRLHLYYIITVARNCDGLQVSKFGLLKD